MKPLGDSFIKLIKMIIAPIIFRTVVVAKGTGDLDVARPHRQLDGETDAEADTPEQVLDASTAHLPT